MSNVVSISKYRARKRKPTNVQEGLISCAFQNGWEVVVESPDCVRITIPSGREKEEDVLIESVSRVLKEMEW